MQELVRAEEAHAEEACAEEARALALQSKHMRLPRALATHHERCLQGATGTARVGTGRHGDVAFAVDSVGQELGVGMAPW